MRLYCFPLTTWNFCVLFGRISFFVSLIKQHQTRNFVFKKNLFSSFTSNGRPSTSLFEFLLLSPFTWNVYNSIFKNVGSWRGWGKIERAFKVLRRSIYVLKLLWITFFFVVCDGEKVKLTLFQHLLFGFKLLFWRYL